ncbi:uncharacterized protein YALI1_E11770g [Yarrowia lipolytica]|uniref:Uncharacterized protein n=1 Tax=Yarrowia lipolytica TaxID=4952 RepID=A0A1D8NHS4_YARLL|nr:hypothetical protein YALI1_E11770g [Yarrowia lipolytica]
MRMGSKRHSCKLRPSVGLQRSSSSTTLPTAPLTLLQHPHNHHRSHVSAMVDGRTAAHPSVSSSSSALQQPFSIQQPFSTSVAATWQ